MKSKCISIASSQNLASELRHALYIKYPSELEKIIWNEKNVKYYIHNAYIDYMFKL